MAVGCASTVTYRQDLSIERTRQRAAFETGCPEEQIVTSNLGGGSIGVEACGQRLVYIVDAPCLTDRYWTGYTRTAAMASCTPVLNTKATPVETPAR